MVKRRKVGGRSGKKKWKRASDTQALQLQDLQEARAQVREASKPKSGDKAPLFKIEVQADAGLKKRLDKDRFKRKDREEEVSKTEAKLLRRTEKGLEEQAREPAPSDRLDDAQPKIDVWNENLNIVYKKPVLEGIGKAYEVPKTLKPHGGQSYNPSLEDQTQLMSLVVERGTEEEEKARARSQTRKPKKQLTKRAPVVLPKPRSKAEALMNEEHARAREKKQKERDLAGFDDFVREQRNKQKRRGTRG